MIACRLLVVAAALLVACKQDRDRKPPPAPAIPMDRHALVEQACPRMAKPNFYKVEKAGKVSYLLGTRHISVPLAKFPPVVRETLDRAQLGVFEIAPDDDAPAADHAISLPDALGSADWARYRTLVDDPAPPTEMSPAAALLGMTVMFEDPNAMLEADLARELASHHIPARGLETSAFQDALIEKLLDLRMLRAAVEQTADRAELARQAHDDLARYCAGDDEDPGIDPELERELLAAGYTAAELAQIDDEMVYARNRDWIPKLETLLATDRVFIAVGVDHLIGPRGVVALLGQRGYAVTRIAP